MAKKTVLKLVTPLSPAEEKQAEKELVESIVDHHRMLFDAARKKGFTRAESMDILKMQAAYDLRPTHPFPSEDFDCDCDDCKDCE